MSKLLITINGKSYEVELEVLEEDSQQGFYPPMPSYGTSFMPPRPAPMPMHAAPAPRPAAPAAPEAAGNAGGGDTLPSPINGVVLEIPVSVGQEVKEGDVVMVLEAMKMKTNISSPRSGKIKQIHAKINDSIESGQNLISFE